MSRIAIFSDIHGTPGGNLLLDFNANQLNAELIKVKYPVNETIAAIRQSDIPDFYADFLLSGIPNNLGDYSLEADTADFNAYLEQSTLLQKARADGFATFQ